MKEFPDEKEAWYGLGEARFHRAGGHGSKTANDAFREAIELDPSFRLAYFHVIDYYELKEMHDEGLAVVQVLIDQDPENPSWHQEMARLLVSKGDDENLHALIDDCMVKMTDVKDKITLLEKVAEAYAKRGVQTERERYLKLAFDLDPEGAGVHTLAGLGWTTMLLGRYDEAEEWFERAQETGDKFAMQVNGAIRLALLRGETDKALAAAERFAEAAPDSLAALARRIEVHLFSEEPDEADRLLESALASREGHSARKELLKYVGPVYMAAGRFAKTEELSRWAISSDGGEADAASHAMLGWALVNLDREEEAAREFERARELNPRGADAFRGFVGLTLAREDFAGAERLLGEWLAEHAPRPATSVMMAHALAGQNRFGEAEPLARQAVAMAPTRETRTVLAWVLIAGDLDIPAGIEEARRAQEAPPEYFWKANRHPLDPPPEHALGLAYLKQGDYRKAVAELTEASRLRPDRPSILEHLRVAEERRGQAIGG